MTLLIGANASGKSNVIEALRLLTWLAQGRRLNDMLRSVQAEAYALRGQLGDLAYNGGDRFSLGCSLAAEHVAEWQDLDLTIAVTNADIHILEEQISSSLQRFPLYRVERNDDPYSHDLPIAYNNFARGGKKPRIVATDQQAVFTQLSTPAHFGSEHSQAQQIIPQVTKTYQSALEAILLLEPHPKRMRDYTNYH